MAWFRGRPLTNLALTSKGLNPLPTPSFRGAPRIAQSGRPLLARLGAGSGGARQREKTGRPALAAPRRERTAGHPWPVKWIAGRTEFTNPGPDGQIRESVSGTRPDSLSALWRTEARTIRRLDPLRVIVVSRRFRQLTPGMPRSPRTVERQSAWTRGNRRP